MRKPNSDIEKNAVRRAITANKKSMRVGDMLVVDIYDKESKVTVDVLLRKVRGDDPGTYKMEAYIVNVPG